MPSVIYYSEPISRGFLLRLSQRSHRERSLREIIATYYVYRTVVIRGIEDHLYVYVYVYAKTSSSFVQTAHSIMLCFPQLHSHVQRFKYLHQPLLDRIYISVNEIRICVHTHSYEHILFQITTRNYRLNNTDYSMIS